MINMTLSVYLKSPRKTMQEQIVRRRTTRSFLLILDLQSRNMILALWKAPNVLTFRVVTVKTKR